MLDALALIDGTRYPHRRCAYAFESARFDGNFHAKYSTPVFSIFSAKQGWSFGKLLKTKERELYFASQNSYAERSRLMI